MKAISALGGSQVRWGSVEFELALAADETRDHWRRQSGWPNEGQSTSQWIQIHGLLNHSPRALTEALALPSCPLYCITVLVWLANGRRQGTPGQHSPGHGRS